MTREEYVNFMYNEDNEYNCTECPENDPDRVFGSGRLPCGQQNCWVTCHCRHLDRG